MTDRNALMELAGKVEAATGPDRELDKAVHDIIYSPRTPEEGEDQPPAGFGRGFLSVNDYWGGKFTASIDDALAVLPRGWAFKIGRNWCEVWPISSELTDEEWPDDWDDDRQHFGKTPALALCAAALRARASLEVD